MNLSRLQAGPLLSILVVLASIAAVGVFLVQHSFSLYDDAYIYFRYVESSFAGCALRYSCGEAPVEGFTSPLYLLALHGLRLFSRDLEATSQLLNAALMIASVSMAALTAGRLVDDQARLVVTIATLAILVLDDHILLNSVVGLETALVTFAVTALFRASARPDEDVTQRGNLLGLLLVLATLARPECALLLLLWPLAIGPFPWRRAVLPALALGAVALVRWWIFGDFVPNTAHAKAGGTAAHLSLGWDYILLGISDFPYCLLAGLALLQPAARIAARLFFPGVVLLMASFLYTGGDTFVYSRFLAPFAPACAALAVVGSASLAGRLSKRSWISGFVPAALALLLAGRAFFAHAIPPQHGFDNVLRYQEAGIFLGRTFKGATLATAAVGAIAYHSGNPIIDLLGLTDRHIARTRSTLPPDRMQRHAIGHERHDAAYVLARQPEVIVTVTWQRRPFRRGDELNVAVHAEWELVERVRSGEANYVPYTPEVAPGIWFLMFVRRDVAEALGVIGG